MAIKVLIVVAPLALLLLVNLVGCGQNGEQEDLVEQKNDQIDRLNKHLKVLADQYSYAFITPLREDAKQINRYIRKFYSKPAIVEKLKVLLALRAKIQLFAWHLEHTAIERVHSILLSGVTVDRDLEVLLEKRLIFAASQDTTKLLKMDFEAANSLVEQDEDIKDGLLKSFGEKYVKAHSILLRANKLAREQYVTLLQDLGQKLGQEALQALTIEADKMIETTCNLGRPCCKDADVEHKQPTLYDDQSQTREAMRASIPESDIKLIMELLKVTKFSNHTF